jgi:uncharacterized beta-barrel protein YwiB (DUF1934 family)
VRITMTKQSKQKSDGKIADEAKAEAKKAKSEVTKKMVTELLRRGETLTGIAYKTGASLASVYNWRAGKLPLDIYWKKLEALLSEYRK